MSLLLHTFNWKSLAKHKNINNINDISEEELTYLYKWHEDILLYILLLINE